MHSGRVGTNDVECTYYVSRGDSHIRFDFHERVLMLPSSAFSWLWAEPVPLGRGCLPPPVSDIGFHTGKAQRGRLTFPTREPTSSSRPYLCVCPASGDGAAHSFGDGGQVQRGVSSCLLCGWVGDKSCETSVEPGGGGWQMSLQGSVGRS